MDKPVDKYKITRKLFCQVVFFLKKPVDNVDKYVNKSKIVIFIVENFVEL